MSSTKVVIIVLVIVAVLFAGGIGMGLWNSSQEDPSLRDWHNFHPGDHAVLGSMNSALSSFAPKVASSSLSPSTKTYNLIANSSYSIKIEPSSDQSFRRLDMTIKPLSSCADLTLKLNDPPKFFSDQPQPLHATASSSDPNLFTFIVTSGGGELQVNGNTSTRPRCVVTLQVGD